MKLKAGHMVAERYEIDDIIGSGGMSVVYRAHDKKLDRYVTLKVLKEEYLTDENLIERFPKEARAAAALNHQNIVSIFDHGCDGDILYIVLEYVDGASLKDLINRKAPFDDETNLGVTIQVAEGLSEAHRNNIIHLDIKPQNILVTTTSIVKVADFGIARTAKSVTLNAAAGSMGSVHYFSPEQARGGYINHKSDTYSLGIVMFEMATGELPFEGENEVSVALQHINDPLPDILKINPNVSDSVVKIIQKATEKSASKRYKTIDDMTEDLKRALTDASGAFVDGNNDEKSPTRSISEENKEAVRRQKIRQAFLDGVETPGEDDAPPELSDGFLLRDEYQYGQEYGEYTEYADDYFEKHVETPRPRDKKADRVAVYGGIILGCVLALIIFLFARNLFNEMLSPTAGMVETPDVMGLPWFQAEMAARLHNLIPVREDEYCFDEDCEGNCEGQVIKQRTDPGRLLSPNDVLHIVVSRGKPGDGVSMPRLVNNTLYDALATLEVLKLELDIQTEYYENEIIPRNTVITQVPAPNERLTDGDIVTLRVSLGPDGALVRIPTLIGSTEASALAALSDLSLTGTSKRQDSELFPSGQIIRQDPAPGEMVPRHSVVTYVISTGPTEPLPAPAPIPGLVDNGTPDDPTDTETPDIDIGTPGNDYPQPTPNPDPDTLELIRGILHIHLWTVPEGTEYVHVLVDRQIGNQEAVPIINDPHVHVSRFPHPLEVEYTDTTVFRIFTFENGTQRLIGTENRP